jgi:hypothetical protein
MAIFKPRKETQAAADDRSILPRLVSLLARIEKATAYDTPGPVVEEIAETAEAEPYAPPPDHEQDFAESFQELESIRGEAVDRPLSSLLKQYLSLMEHKHRAWRWLQNYPEASLPEQDRMWNDLQAAGGELTPLREELNERIGQLDAPA